MTNSVNDIAKLICFDLHAEFSEHNIAVTEAKIIRFMDEALKLLKNIRETSLNDTERVARLIEAEAKFGIPKTHSL